MIATRREVKSNVNFITGIFDKQVLKRTLEKDLKAGETMCLISPDINNIKLISNAVKEISKEIGYSYTNEEDEINNNMSIYLVITKNDNGFDTRITQDAYYMIKSKFIGKLTASSMKREVKNNEA